MHARSTSGHSDRIKAIWSFATSVTKRYRFTRSEEQAEFLNTVLVISPSKEEIIPIDSIVYRAQRGHSWIPVDVDPGVIEEVPYHIVQSE